MIYQYNSDELTLGNFVYIISMIQIFGIIEIQRL